jgi:hypothetical protein
MTFDSADVFGGVIGEQYLIVNTTYIKTNAFITRLQL